MAEMNASAENLGKIYSKSGIFRANFSKFASVKVDQYSKYFQRFFIEKLFVQIRYFYKFTEVTNNGRPMNPSLSEDSVADTAISKRNSDGMNF